MENIQSNNLKLISKKMIVVNLLTLIISLIARLFQMVNVKIGKT